MAHHVQRVLTFSNVCSFLALMVALGTGGAYAVGTIDSHDIKNRTIRSVDLKDGQVKAADLGAGSVGAAAIQAGAVDGGRLLDGGVARADLGADSVDGSKVADQSIGVADLVGVEAPGSVSLSGILNGRCTQVTFNVQGAQVGQAALVTTGAAIQNGIVLYAQRVMSADHVEVNACNFSGTTMTAISGFPVTVFTFG